MEIFTNTDFIAPNLHYPPLYSEKRLNGYKKNLKRYKGEYNSGKYIALKDLKGGYIKYNLVTENYFRLCTEKLASLLLNEKPNVLCDSTENTQLLNKCIENCSFWSTLQQAFRTYSYLGDGVLYLYKDENGMPMVNSINPSNWFKVVSSENINKTLCHILVQPIFKEDYLNVVSDSQITHLRVLYHYKGYYIEKVFAYQQPYILEPVDYNMGAGVIPKRGRKVKTGFSDFAVFNFGNCVPIDEIYGISDYEGIANSVELYEITLTLISAILQKNLDPIVQIPKGSTRQNSATGQVEFNGLGSAVEVSDSQKDIKYIGLEAPIGETMNYTEKLLDEIAIQSEMSKSLLTGEYSGALSGEALKTLLKSPLDKISRCIDTLDGVIKKIFVQMLSIYNVNVEPASIVIEWQDGLTESNLEKANTIKTLRDANVISKKRVLMKYDGLSEDQADSELAQIEKEIRKEES